MISDSGFRGVVLGLLLRTVTSPAVASAEPVCDTSFVTPVLRVEVEPSIADASLFPLWISDRNADLAARIPPMPGHDQWVSLALEGSTYNYRVTVIAMRDGVPILPAGSVHSCRCNSETLLEEIDGWIELAIDRLREVPAAESPTRSASAVVASRPRPELTGLEGWDSDEDSDREHRGLGPVRYAGLGLGAVGAGAVATGVGLFMRKPESRDGADGDVDVRDLKVPGFILVAGGSLALATGVTLVVFETMRHRDRRMSVAPSLRSGFAGATIDGRF